MREWENELIILIIKILPSIVLYNGQGVHLE